MNVNQQNNRRFSFIMIFALLINLVTMNINATSNVSAESKVEKSSNTPKEKVFKSKDTGNFTYEDAIASIEWLDRIAKNEPSGKHTLGTRYKTDENDTIVYCLNWNLDSPKKSGNTYVTTEEKITDEEYTAMIYGYGGKKDRTGDFTNPKTKKKYEANERYYITQMALYAVTNDKGTKKHLRLKDMVEHNRDLIDEKKVSSKAILKAVKDQVKYIENNTVKVPKKETIEIEIEGSKKNEMIDNGSYLQTEKPVKVNTSNSKGELELDKENLGKAYFVDADGNKMKDNQVLEGKETFLRLDKSDAKEKGTVSFDVFGTVEYENLTKYVPKDEKDTGAEGKELQRITWVSTETTETESTFKTNYKQKNPEVDTSASFIEIDSEDTNMVTLIDEVNYEYLIEGKEYTVKGKLMDKETGEPVLNDDKEITGETKFTPEKHKGSVDVKFTFDRSELDTDSVVVFEDIYDGDEVVAKHHDIDDEKQTVNLPGITTSASFVEVDENDTDMVTLKDGVKYENLVKGEEYTVKGKLMDKETGEPVFIDDEEVTGETTFTVEDSNGSVEVQFTFDRSKLDTDSVVVFEDVYKDDALIAVHHDIDDENQTVDVPNINTAASFFGRDTDDINMVTLVDEITYNNLTPDKEYTVKGKLMDKETEEPIIIDDEEVTGETTFTAEESNGTVDIEFTFDQSELEADSVVVFEDVYNDERLVAVHHDINDEAQTVNLVDVKVVKTDSETEEALEGAEFTIYDVEENEIDTQVTDEEGYAYFEIVEGEEAVLKETDIPEGYVIDEPEYVVSETEGKELVEVDVVNQRIKGDLEIVKLDGSNNERLANAKFAVIDSDDEVVEEIATDEEGIAYFEGLDYGEYKLVEIEAPKGYKLDEFEYSFEIKEYKEVVKVEVTNDKVKEATVTKVTEDDEILPPKEESKEEPKEEPKGKLLPQTATDNFNLLLVGALLLLVGAITFFIRKKSKKADENN